MTRRCQAPVGEDVSLESVLCGKPAVAEVEIEGVIFSLCRECAAQVEQELAVEPPTELADPARGGRKC